VTECATTLTSCAASAAGVSTTPPAAPTCGQQFTACLNKNPLNFLGCAAALAGCQN
jgi:hypothetical protein